jgi:16S rRNA (cytosine967-C5)-methyltransferase
VAYDAFVAVMEEKRRPEDILEHFYDQYDQKLRRLDRNFIKEILYGSLRWYSKLYWILQNTSNRNLDDSTPEIRAALVVGTYQIYYMDRVPDRAAVNESVEYIRKKGQASACSFVNGILRQIARRSKYFQKPDSKTHPVEYLSLQYAHPEWLIKRWVEQFRFEKLETLLSANNKPPPYSIRVNVRKTEVSQLHLLQQQLLRDESIHSEKSHLRTALRLKEAPVLGEGSLFAQGFYTIQDEASQLIGHLVNPEEGQTILDACSGPGGKLSHICELGQGKIRLTAVEKSFDQIEKAKKTMVRLGFQDEVTFIHQDFLEWQPNPEDPPIDKILLDAPCSGLGVLRRHPEGKWQKNHDLIPSMVEQQNLLIQKTLKLLKVGGELIYSVCSFEPEESEVHLKMLQQKYGAKIEILSPVSRLPDYYKRYVTRKNLLTIYGGNQDDMDGFAAFIIKIKEPLG